tara:strand:- start:199 stop:777 length:579 start_codon:yes stop_codon:yes gene_type:complete
MDQEFKLRDSDRAKVEKEISSLQQRVIRIIIPTMLSIGLVSIAGTEEYGKVAMAGTFAILMSSGMFVAALSYKIFQNAAFLRVFVTPVGDPAELSWEDALIRFRRGWISLIIPTETTAAAIIYFLFAGAYLYAFKDVDPTVAYITYGVLNVTPASLLFFYFWRRSNEKRWETIRLELVDIGKERLNKQNHTE